MDGYRRLSAKLPLYVTHSLLVTLIIRSNVKFGWFESLIEDGMVSLYTQDVHGNGRVRLRRKNMIHVTGATTWTTKPVA
jgi:hypothetical protein